MNLKELREIIAIFEDANISELDVERQGMKIRLKKGTGGTEISQSSVEIPSGTAAPHPEPEKEQAEKHTEIKSPMVGTFYRTPAPDASPFVEEGDEIEKGQVICIIEAMKLMNEIKAEVNGRIKKILVENGQAVEFNQPIFLIEVV